MLRLGIVGIGKIANDYIGLIAGNDVQEIEIAALCSRNTAHVREMAEQYGLKSAVFSDYTAMLHSGQIDAVLICTPHAQHPIMARQAIEAGIHVLVEKPVGIFADEVAEVVRMLQDRPGLICGVMYNRRASMAYRHVHDLVQNGSLGEMVRASWIITNLYRTDAYYTSSPWRGSWENEGGGLLMTQASHQIDLMQWICGMPVSVTAHCSTIDRSIQVENDATLFLSYPNGASGHFIASAHECPGTNRLEICGTQGTVSITDDCIVKVWSLSEDERLFAKHCHDPFEKVPGSMRTLTFGDTDNKIQQAATVQNFANTIRGNEKIYCSLEDGLKSLEIIHGAYLSDWLNETIKLPADELYFRNNLVRKHM